jgi:hypothetical protein
MSDIERVSPERVREKYSQETPCLCVHMTTMANTGECVLMALLRSVNSNQEFPGLRKTERSSSIEPDPRKQVLPVGQQNIKERIFKT